MKKINQTQAIRLIAAGEAGYYAASANPPLRHDKQIAVECSGEWYLCAVPDEISIELKEAIPTSDTHGKGIFAVKSCDELGHMVQAEIDKLQRGPDIAGVPTYVQGGGDHPDLRN